MRDHYSDFGPTLACEYLTAQHGYSGSNETLRTWMIAAGLCKAKRSRVRRIHSPRTRRSCAVAQANWCKLTAARMPGLKIVRPRAA